MPVIQILAVVGLMQSLQGMNSGILQACDRAGTLLRCAILTVILSLVAFARRDQREKLIDLRLGTVAALAGAPGELDPGPLGHNAYDVLRYQAALSGDAPEPQSGMRTGPCSPRFSWWGSVI